MKAKNILFIAVGLFLVYTVGTAISNVNKENSNVGSGTGSTGNIVITSGATETEDQEVFVLSDYLKSVMGDARSRCHGRIKDMLKSPSTADFASVFDSKLIASQDQVLIKEMFPTDIHNDKTFALISYVDSQNSFGAMLRTNIACLFEYDPDQKDMFLKNIMTDPS